MKSFKIYFIIGILGVLLTNSVFAKETRKPWFMERFGRLNERQNIQNNILKNEDSKFLKSNDTLGTIMGTVADNYGNPLKGIEFEVHNLEGNHSWSSGNWKTDSLGQYTIHSLNIPFVSCKLKTVNSTGYIDEWYNNKYDIDSANIINVTFPDTMRNINFELSRGGYISGYITSNKGSPLKNVRVYIYDTNIKDYYMSETTTDSNGYYIITYALLTGNYKVRTYNEESYVDLYWNNKSNWNEANTVSVTAPDTAKNINFNLYMGAKIKGKVYGTKGVLEGVDIVAFNTNSGEWMETGETDSTGNYVITNLPTGCYKLWASPNIWNDTVHAFEWYNNKNNWQTADSIYVTVPDSVLNIDFNLEKNGIITGTVYGASPIDSARVSAWFYLNSWYNWLSVSSKTGIDGTYKLINLRTGDYKVSASKTGYETRWYNDAPDSASADLVSVTMPNTTPNIDFNLTGIEESAGLKDRVPKIKTTQNPFIRTTTISYQIPMKTKVLLKIYDITGRPVKTLVNGEKEAGSYDVSFNAIGLSAGIYFVRFAAGNYKSTKKLVLMR
ncbi:MAG: T9SS type A sorting domain-containing protein [bacterium]